MCLADQTCIPSHHYTILLLYHYSMTRVALATNLRMLASVLPGGSAGGGVYSYRCQLGVKRVIFSNLANTDRGAAIQADGGELVIR